MAELRPQKRVQIREICPKFCILNRRKSVENELLKSDSGDKPPLFHAKMAGSSLFSGEGVSKILRRLNFGSGHGGPGKKRRLRRSFPPPCGQAVFVTENISRNGKHSLLSPEHIMFRGLKNGSNITPRSHLFAGQSEEANHPFPKPTSGTKSTKKGRSGGVLFKKAD